MMCGLHKVLRIPALPGYVEHRASSCLQIMGLYGQAALARKQDRDHDLRTKRPSGPCLPANKRVGFARNKRTLPIYQFLRKRAFRASNYAPREAAPVQRLASFLCNVQHPSSVNMRKCTISDCKLTAFERLEYIVTKPRRSSKPIAAKSFTSSSVIHGIQTV